MRLHTYIQSGLVGLLSLYLSTQSYAKLSSAGDDECGLYIAPSTIPDAGLGMFTSKPLKANQKIGNGDISIPIYDLYFHMGLEQDNFFNPFDDYIWAGWAIGIDRESSNPDDDAVSGFCPGIDAAVNCNVALINTGVSVPQYDNGGLHRSKDPGSGAISPYHGTTRTNLPVAAGGELFKFYGDSWYHAREHIFGDGIPLEKDWPKAQTMVESFAELSAGLDDEAKEDLWKMVKEWPWQKRIINAVPEKSNDIAIAAEKGLHTLHEPGSMRSIEELVAEGRCMDSIKPAPSTLPQAGRGAFATRWLQADSIITGSPFLHIPDGRQFTMIYDYNVSEDGTNIRNEDIIIGRQLLLNYCFGHSQSTLLLCPYGAGSNYINHNKTEANVMIKWAPNGVIAQNDDFFNKDMAEMEQSSRVSLAFDFFCTEGH